MLDRLPIQKTIPSTEARTNLSELLDRVCRREEVVVVEKLGSPVAAIISMTDYEQFRRLVALEMHRELVRTVGAEAERQGLTEEKLLEELRETRKEFFAETYGDKQQPS